MSTSRHDTTHRRTNWWIELVRNTYQESLAAWEAEAEAVAIGYATELAEFAEANPKPTFRKTMEDLAGIGADHHDN